MFFHPFAFDANCETHGAAEPRSPPDKGNLPPRGNKHGERIRAGGVGGGRLGLKDREPNGTRAMKYAARRALKFNPVC